MGTLILVFGVLQALMYLAIFVLVVYIVYRIARVRHWVRWVVPTLWAGVTFGAGTLVNYVLSGLAKSLGNQAITFQGFMILALLTGPLYVGGAVPLIGWFLKPATTDGPQSEKGAGEGRGRGCRLTFGSD